MPPANRKRGVTDGTGAVRGKRRTPIAASPRAPKTDADEPHLSPRARTKRRVSFNLRESDDDRLRLIAERIDGTDNDAMRRALSTFSYLQKLIDEGGTVIVEDAHGRQRVVEFLLP